jgi:MFS transporter, AAHS family, benzoate transport protein
MSTTTSTASRTTLGLAAVFAALAGYDLSCYGATVPSLLADRATGADKASAGTVGSLLAIGMLVGAALSAAMVRRFATRRLVLGGCTLLSAGMLVCAAAHAFWLFGAARLVVGIGLGIVLPTITAGAASGHRCQGTVGGPVWGAFGRDNFRRAGLWRIRGRERGVTARSRGP